MFYHLEIMMLKLTVPSDHILDATGELQKQKNIFSKDMMKRFNKAKKTYDKPVSNSSRG